MGRFRARNDSLRAVCSFDCMPEGGSGITWRESMREQYSLRMLRVRKCHALQAIEMRGVWVPSVSGKFGIRVHLDEALPRTRS